VDATGERDHQTVAGDFGCRLSVPADRQRRLGLVGSATSDQHKALYTQPYGRESQYYLDEMDANEYLVPKWIDQHGPDESIDRYAAHGRLAREAEIQQHCLSTYTTHYGEWP
jgi:hypothetical protein